MIARGLTSLASFCLVASVFGADPIAVSDNCKIGERRPKGSYFDVCIPKFETAGCYAKWETDPNKKFVENSETRDRLYHQGRVGFRYQCSVADGYIQFSPIGCTVVRATGSEFLALNATGTMDDGQQVRCKQNSKGAFSFEFGDKKGK